MSVSEFIYTVILRPRPLRLLANSAIRAIVPTVLHRHGAKISLNPRDPVVSGALTLNVYEHAETEFFLATCRQGMTFLDIGANIGYYTALALTQMKGSGRIIALEPDPENYSFLQKTVSINKNGGTAVRVDCVQKAASDHRGVMELFTSSENRGDNRLYANQLADASCKVEVTTIDDLLNELDVRDVDFIKMDVQGYEGQVLKGMKGVLERSPAVTFLSEFWPEGLRNAGTDPVEFLSMLRELGFELHQLHRKARLEPIMDPMAFVQQYTGRAYTNIVARKRGVTP